MFLVGDFSRGIDSKIIDLLFVGNIDKSYLVKLIDKAESLVKRKIRYLIYNEAEFSNGSLEKFDPEPLLIWSKE